MIIFSDLHLREETAATVFDQVLPGIFQASEERGDDDIACLGDLYHIRYRVPVRLQNRLAEVLRDWTTRGKMVYLLPGNHDQVNTEGRHALEVFADIPGVCVFTEPTWTLHGLWIPYRKDPEAIAAALRKRKKRGAQKVLFMHHGIRGAMMAIGHQDNEGLDPGKLKDYRTVLCGHYHLQQTIDGFIHYIGSPYQTRASEAGQDKGYAVWDGKSLERVQTRWGKRYHLVRGASGPVDLSDVQPGDDVRVTAAPGADAEAISQALEAAGVTHVVTPEVAAQEARLQVRAGSPLRDYAQAYVDTIEHGLDNTRLLRTFNDLVGI